MKQKYVYHCSTKQNLETIKPAVSTHGKCWVYAAKDIAISAAFLSGIGGDFTCQVGRDRKSKKPYICERFAGALEMRYKNHQGSIYVLPSKNFLQNQTDWEEEVICEGEIKSVDEIRIDDSLEFLFKLQNEKKLLICSFPSKIDNIPQDNMDLVEKALLMARNKSIPRDAILSQIERWHPQLLNQIKATI